MDLSPDLAPLTVVPTSHTEAKQIRLVLEVEGIEAAVNPPLGVVKDWLAEGSRSRSIGSHTVYVRPEDLARALATVREHHLVPGYLLQMPEPTPGRDPGAQG